MSYPAAMIIGMSYLSTSKTACSAKHHLIWCPKHRRRVLKGRVGERLQEIIAGRAGEMGAEAIEVEAMPDHVHLFVEIPPAVALSRFAGLAKGRSSRLLQSELPCLRRLPCLWSPSWLPSTVGDAPLEVVRRHVESQEAVA